VKTIIYGKDVKNNEVISVFSINIRKTIYIAGAFCMLSGIIRMLCTFPGLNDSLDEDVQYMLTLVAQIAAGVANPLAMSLPTKVSI